METGTSVRHPPAVQVNTGTDWSLFLHMFKCRCFLFSISEKVTAQVKEDFSTVVLKMKIKQLHIQALRISAYKS